MLFPRRRITSLTILALFTLTLYQLSTYWSGSKSQLVPPLGQHVKAKPKDDRLTPEPPDALGDQASLSEPSPTILTDPRPPPREVSSAAQSEASKDPLTEHPEAGQVNRWDSGQHTFGPKKFVAKHPVKLVQDLPRGLPLQLPRLQHSFKEETEEAEVTRVERLTAVKESFQRSWSAYKEYAWLHDELKPKSARGATSFGGWGATLVDTLDTLWLMGMKDEFEDAIAAAMKIDFTNTTSTTLNVFETTIRYLGGFLGAHDISEGN